MLQRVGSPSYIQQPVRRDAIQLSEVRFETREILLRDLFGVDVESLELVSAAALVAASARPALPVAALLVVVNRQHLTMRCPSYRALGTSVCAMRLYRWPSPCPTSTSQSHPIRGDGHGGRHILDTERN